jgi:hypothetical protein
MLWHVSFMSVARGEHCTPRALPFRCTISCFDSPCLRSGFEPMSRNEPEATPCCLRAQGVPWLSVLSAAMDERGLDPCEVAFEFLS